MIPQQVTAVAIPDIDPDSKVKGDDRVLVKFAGDTRWHRRRVEVNLDYPGYYWVEGEGFFNVAVKP